MKLKELLKGVKYIAVKGNLDVDIKSLCQNIDKIQYGSLLFCYEGVNFNTHNFITDSVNKKAVALVVEQWVNSPLPQILVRNTRKIMPKICKNFYNNPTKRLKIIGVTGTNGKTTTTYIINNILREAAIRSALIGTNGIFIEDEKIASNLTTPDVCDLYYIFNLLKEKGIDYVVMEVSAHAIDLYKILGLKFVVGAFTNLSQDHLDYFSTMGKYARCKLNFLQKKYCKNVVINVDDKYGEMFSKISNSNVFTYGIDKPAQNFAMNIVKTLKGMSFLMNVFDEVFDVRSSLVCQFNVYNILLATVICKVLGINNDYIYKGIVNTKKINGRMNIYKLINEAIVVIDFAHTPDSMEKVLVSLREVCKGSLSVVFGCGGDRDRLKRPKMGSIADFYADKIFLTSDNPRNENPIKIINEVAEGIKLREYFIIENRESAINEAILQSKKDDIILITGKGCEEEQDYGNNKIKFSDFDAIKKYIKITN